MLTEKFVEALAALATRAAVPVEIKSGDPRKVAYAVDGKTFETPVMPAPRDHKAGSLEDLIALANRFAEGGGKPAVWYDGHAVVLVIDDDGRRLERATLALEPSDAFATLTRLRDSKAKHDQKAFVRLLRIDLAGALDPVVLLNPARKVKFASESVTTGNVGRQKESMGRDITSRAETDGGELPEEVTLSVPVYKTFGERTPRPVRCSVEVDPGEGTFRLLPLPDELEHAGHLAVASIEERLNGGLVDTVPAYMGKP